jgi:catalase
MTSGNGRWVEGRLIRSDLPETDDFTQAGEYYCSLSPVQKEHLVDNLSTDLAGISKDTQNIVLSYLCSASEELGKKVTQQIEMQTRR